jgi:hypothetical protein
MRLNKYLLVLITLINCADSSEDKPEEVKPVTITYKESTEDFPNPDRGFYHYSETRASNYSLLSETTLKGYRTPKRASGAQYDVVSTLVFRYYVLDQFKDTPLSETYLNNVRADMAVVKKAGVKLIPRFTYTTQANSGDCDESFICPPYGDASKSVVLNHIAQLKPIFQEHAALISCVQMGFIGTWGENYYTDFFGDASSNGQQKLLDENWTDRLQVLQALLDAVPDEIMVQVRYPQLKQRMVYGINALVSSAALTAQESFSGTDKARLGFHNDCLLASADDFGTYEDYGNSSSPRGTANTTLRKYFAEESKYVPVGGETCNDGYSPQNDCEPTGKADKELREMHYSYLNTNYNNQVNNDWVDGGCMESIKRNLGYRFVLKDATFDHVTESKSLKATINLDNVGYASPFNFRPVQFVLGDTINNIFHTFEIETDTRHWLSGAVKIEQTFDLTNIAAGNYTLFLSIPDQHEELKDRHEYAIRLANENIWYEEKGLNKLQHTISVK